MKESLEHNLERAKRLAEKGGYPIVEYVCRWHQFDVFCAKDEDVYEEKDGIKVLMPTGFPTYILVKDFVTRFAKDDEMEKIMAVTA